MDRQVSDNPGVTYPYRCSLPIDKSFERRFFFAMYGAAILGRWWVLLVSVMLVVLPFAMYAYMVALGQGISFWALGWLVLVVYFYARPVRSYLGARNELREGFGAGETWQSELSPDGISCRSETGHMDIAFGQCDRTISLLGFVAIRVAADGVYRPVPAEALPPGGKAWVRAHLAHPS
jgi:hypothetical protein